MSTVALYLTCLKKPTLTLFIMAYILQNMHIASLRNKVVQSYDFTKTLMKRTTSTNTFFFTELNHPLFVKMLHSSLYTGIFCAWLILPQWFYKKVMKMLAIDLHFVIICRCKRTLPLIQTD